MRKQDPGKPRGILNPAAIQKEFRYGRYAPSEVLAFHVEHFWVVQWDLRGRSPYVSETLPHPSIHVVIEEGRSGVGGVHTGKFSRELEGVGRVFSIKFRPGAFRPFIDAPLSTLTNRTLSLSDVFGPEGDAFEESMLALDEDAALVECAEQFLQSKLSNRDGKIEMVNTILEYILTHKDVIAVENVADRFRMNTRALQRLFSEYVGAGPKWVIKRYWLHEAAEQLAKGAIVDLPKLALDLGYFDQAHFIKDFKTIVGKSPGEYVRHIRGI